MSISAVSGIIAYNVPHMMDGFASQLITQTETNGSRLCEISMFRTNGLNVDFEL